MVWMVESIFQGLVNGFGHHIVVDVLLYLAGVAWSRVWPFATQQFGNTLNLGWCSDYLRWGARGSAGCWQNWCSVSRWLICRAPHTPPRRADGGVPIELTFWCSFFSCCWVSWRNLSAGLMCSILSILVALVLARYSCARNALVGT